MSWTTALEDLKTQLSDGDQDKHRYRKPVIGRADGSNKVFKTFEGRRVEKLTTAPAPNGIYVNGSRVTVSADDEVSGEFELSSAPADGDRVEATYYYRWFLDTELNKFLDKASEWLQIPVVENVPQGLRGACVLWAAKLACEKLAIKWAETLSSTYMMEDAPKKDQGTPSNQYLQMAKQYEKQARDARDDYYSRAGQDLAPRFGVVSGRVRDVTPKR